MLWRVACHQQDVLDFDRPILEHHSGPFPTTLLVYRTLAVVLESTSRAHGSLLNRFHGRLAAATKCLGRSSVGQRDSRGTQAVVAHSRPHAGTVATLRVPRHSLGERGRGKLASSFG